MSVTWNHEIRDGNMIYREGCCLSTDTKPTTDPTLGNGSKLLEMDTSEMWIYDADGCEWFGPDGALNDTIRFIRPKLIYNDEYVGIDFRLKLPAGKTPSDYPGSYVKLAGTYNNNTVWNDSEVSVNANTQFGLDAIWVDGVCHVRVLFSDLVSARLYTPTFYYTENGSVATVVGQAFSLENVLEFEIMRSTGQYKKELKAFADVCYYSLRYQNRNSQTAYANTTLRYNIYDRTPNENRIAFYPYIDHHYVFKDDNITSIGTAINRRPKWDLNIGAVVDQNYTIENGTVDDVTVTVGTSGGRRTMFGEFLPIRTGLAHIYTFKINGIVRVRASMIGWFVTMINYSGYDSDKALHNWAYAVLQYAKITHQI